MINISTLILLQIFLIWTFMCQPRSFHSIQIIFQLNYFADYLQSTGFLQGFYPFQLRKLKCLLNALKCSEMFRYDFQLPEALSNTQKCSETLWKTQKRLTLKGFEWVNTQKNSKIHSISLLLVNILN